MILKKKTQLNGQSTSSTQVKPKKSMATLRIQKDLAEYKQQQISFVKLSFPNQSQIKMIHVSISPQQNSLYWNCKVVFSLQFPDSYPMDPPKLLCLNKIYHPNIGYNGRVCLPLVRQDFSPTVNLTSIICGLIYVLTYPNADDALNPQIGDLMLKDFNMFEKIIYHTIQGRAFKNLQYDKIRCHNILQSKQAEIKGNTSMKSQNVQDVRYPEKIEQDNEAINIVSLSKLNKHISKVN